jgi:hypothetical protein
MPKGLPLGGERPVCPRRSPDAPWPLQNRISYFAFRISFFARVERETETTQAYFYDPVDAATRTAQALRSADPPPRKT